MKFPWKKSLVGALVTVAGFILYSKFGVNIADYAPMVTLGN